MHSLATKAAQSFGYRIYNSSGRNGRTLKGWRWDNPTRNAKAPRHYETQMQAALSAIRHYMKAAHITCNVGQLLVEAMDDFTKHYLICALWSSTDDHDAPLDSTYMVRHIDIHSMQDAYAECMQFQEKHAELLAQAYALYDEKGMSQHPEAGSAQACAGHDFWLTRNGHGAGFWDRGFGEVGDKLTKLVGFRTEYPEVNAYEARGRVFLG